ncbi:MAG: cbb3-type cytochrome c oxidase subunit 3 [Gammaproteobacteria bacterium]|nr:cbb3-type cytochrome c oxidase subunit 3 [Gammaproteobacteria bacterium]
MDIALIQTIWTLVIAALFVAVVIWAFGGKRKKSFEEAGNIPLEEDGDDIHG